MARSVGRQLRVVGVVKRSIQLARLRRQAFEKNVGGEGLTDVWSQEAVASRLGMSPTTYADREPATNPSKNSAAEVDVDTLAAIACVLGTYPSVLLLPDDDTLDAGARVEVCATSGVSLGTVDASEYGLWVLGLAPLPGQLSTLFDVAGRVSLAETTAKTARGVKAGPMDPWMEQQRDRPLDADEDYSTRSDVELGLRVMSACRGCIQLMSQRDRLGPEDSIDDLDHDIQEQMKLLTDMLAELGRRRASRRASN